MADEYANHITYEERDPPPPYEFNINTHTDPTPYYVRIYEVSCRIVSAFALAKRICSGQSSVWRGFIPRGYDEGCFMVFGSKTPRDEKTIQDKIQRHPKYIRDRVDMHELPSPASPQRFALMNDGAKHELAYYLQDQQFKVYVVQNTASPKMIHKLLSMQPAHKRRVVVDDVNEPLFACVKRLEHIAPLPSSPQKESKPKGEYTDFVEAICDGEFREELLGTELSQIDEPGKQARIAALINDLRAILG